MSIQKCAIVGAVMLLVSVPSLAAEEPSLAWFNLGGNNGINAVLVDFMDYQGARQIGIGWMGGENPSWLVTIADLDPYVYGVWVDSTEVTGGAYAPVTYPTNNYCVVATGSYLEDIDPAFELKLYWDGDADGQKDPGEPLKDTQIMYLF